MGKYRIITSPYKKEIFIKVEGIYTISDANLFITDFKREVSKITPSEYNLSFDCTYLGVTSPPTLYKLEECFALYRDLNFKKVTINTGGNFVLRNQMKKLSTQHQLSCCQIT